MTEPLRFGIIGTGNIANQFAQGVAGAHRATVTAVGSRSQAAADDFAGKNNITRAHGTYDALITDDQVDAVYVSTPNSLHSEWTIKALQAGKHVLCEKPIAVSEAEAGEMFNAAEKAGRVLVEAFMYRSHPLTKRVLELVRSGAIGDIQQVRTSFCYYTRKIEGNVRFSRELVGGALMDIGCYCIDFSRLMIGRDPIDVAAFGKMHPAGVDEQAACALDFGDGVLATFTCGMRVHADNSAYILGSEGYITVPIPWKPPVEGATCTVRQSIPPRMDGGKPGPTVEETVHKLDAPSPLYGMEADDFAAVVQDGASPIMTREDSLANMRILDRARAMIWT